MHYQKNSRLALSIPIVAPLAVTNEVIDTLTLAVGKTRNVFSV